MKNWLLKKVFCKLTRIEIVDYRGIVKRHVSNRIISASFQLQDDEATLKIYVEK